MAKLILEISEEVQSALKLPPAEIEQELKKELALALYQRGALSLGMARQLSEMSLWEFEELLAKRRITRHYSEEDLQEDLDHARDG